ncbi:MAG: hypothetical protein WBQ37_07975 [Candidatus Competibacter sp.]
MDGIILMGLENGIREKTDCALMGKPSHGGRSLNRRNVIVQVAYNLAEGERFSRTIL